MRKLDTCRGCSVGFSPLGGQTLGGERVARRRSRDTRYRRGSFFCDLGQQPGLNGGGRLLLLR